MVWCMKMKISAPAVVTMEPKCQISWEEIQYINELIAVQVIRQFRNVMQCDLSVIWQELSG